MGKFASSYARWTILERCKIAGDAYDNLYWRSNQGEAELSSFAPHEAVVDSTPHFPSLPLCLLCCLLVLGIKLYSKRFSFPFFPFLLNLD